MQHKLKEVVEFDNSLEMRVFVLTDGKTADFWQLGSMFFKTLEAAEEYVSGITPEMMEGTTKYNLLCLYARVWHCQ